MKKLKKNILFIYRIHKLRLLHKNKMKTLY